MQTDSKTFMGSILEALMDTISNNLNRNYIKLKSVFFCKNSYYDYNN